MIYSKRGARYWYSKVGNEVESTTFFRRSIIENLSMGPIHQLASPTTTNRRAEKETPNKH